jgi:membrane-associated phospholipid phosphatase
LTVAVGWLGLDAVVTLVRRNWGRLLVLFCGVLLPMAIFAALAEDVAAIQRFWWDEPVLTWLHGLATPTLDLTMVWVSRIAMWWCLVPVDLSVVGVLLWRRRWSRATFFALAVGGAGLLNVTTKQLFGRERPALWPSIAPATGFSFPSGHAMGSVATVAAFAVLLWKTPARWAVILGGSAWAVLVSASRAYLGVHYPSDLLAAWAASLAWVFGLAWVFHVGSWDRLRATEVSPRKPLPSPE